MGRRIVFVIYPGITALDLVGPHEVFTAAAEVARRTGGEPDAYRVEVASIEAGPLTTTRGPGGRRRAHAGIDPRPDRHAGRRRRRRCVCGVDRSRARRMDPARRDAQSPGRIGVHRRVPPRRSRRARRTPGDDALALVRRPRAPASRCNRRSRSDLRARRQRVDVGGRDRRHGPRARPGRRRSRT